jgi:hypothetical protein
MSVTPFPDPRTNQFNPSAWDFATYFKYLNSIVTFPRAQNAVINFVTQVYLTTRTALTQWADTAYSTSEIVAWLATVNFGAALTSAVLQYYYGGIRVATINPLTAGATLAIGNGATTNNVSIMSASNTGILTLGSSGSTTSLGAPLTPLYAYPVIPVGAIGYRPPITQTNNLVGNPSAAGYTVRGVNVTAGVWMMCGTITWSSYPEFYTMLFTTTLGGITGNLVQKGSFFPTGSKPIPLKTSLFGIASLSAGFLGFNGRCLPDQLITNADFVVIRVG